MRCALLILVCGVVLLFPVKGFAQPTFDFALQMGGGDERAEAVALDALGNIYVAGIFFGTTDFNPGAGTFNLTSTGPSSNGYVMKLDASGNFLWAGAFLCSSYLEILAMQVDSSGNVFTTGRFTGTADFNPGGGTFNVTDTNKVFITKLDTSGNFAWTRILGGEYCKALVLDGSGSIYTTGTYSTTADFDPGAGIALLNNAGADDTFVSKLDSAGNFLWVRQLGDSMTGIAGMAITVDGSSSNVYIGGTFGGTCDFDPGAGTFNLTSGNVDDFVCKLDAASGNFVWARKAGGTDLNRVSGIALDTFGNVLTTGDIQGTTDFDPGAGTFNLTSGPNAQIFVWKLDSLGNFVWARMMGGTGGNANGGLGIALDGANNVYTTGWFSGTGDFDPGVGVFNMTGNVFNDIFVSKLDSSGNFVWAYGTGDSGLDQGSSIIVNGTDNFYIAGHFSGTADFDFGDGIYTLTNVGGTEEAFVAKPGLGPDVPAANGKALSLTALALVLCMIFAATRLSAQTCS